MSLKIIRNIQLDTAVGILKGYTTREKIGGEEICYT